MLHSYVANYTGNIFSEGISHTKKQKSIVLLEVKMMQVYYIIFNNGLV